MATPLPPEHPHTLPFGYDNPYEEAESKHPNASFLLLPQSHGTRSHIPNTIEPSNDGQCFINHDQTTTPNQPSLMLLTPSPTTRKPYSPLSAPPPLCITVAVLEASIHAMKSPNYCNYDIMMMTKMTTIMTPMTTTDNKEYSLSLAPLESLLV